MTEETTKWSDVILDEHTDDSFSKPFYIPSDDTLAAEHPGILKFKHSIIQRLISVNEFLMKDLTKLTRNYELLVKESNERIRNLTIQISAMRNKIERIERARAPTIEIPEAWLEDDED